MSETGPKPDKGVSFDRPDNQDSHGHSGGDNGDVHQRGGRNRNRNTDTRPKKAKFKGKCEAIEEYVYDVGLPTSNQELYSNTTKNIAEYIARTYDDAGEFRNGLMKLKLPEINKPELNDFGKKGKDDKIVIDEGSREEWKEEIKSYRKDLKTRRKNKAKAFALILGQCSDMLRSKLEGHDDWETANAGDDPIELLKIIKHCMVHKTTTRHKGYSLIEAEGNLGRFRQGEKMTVEDYRERLVSLIDIYRDVGGEPGKAQMMINEYGSEEDALEAYTALLMINKSDPKRYGDLINDLSNQYTRGLDGYPNTITKAFDMLVNYKPPRRNNGTSYPKNELSFATIGEDDHSARGGGRGRGRGRGYGRGRGGGFQGKDGGIGDNQNKQDSDNYDTSYSDKGDTHETSISLKHAESRLPRHWLLMDSCSSKSIISNRNLLHGIRSTGQKLRVHCSAGSKVLDKQAWFGDYPVPVWYDPDGPANILSMGEVMDHFRITMDSQEEHSINMFTSDGRTIKFKPLTARIFSHELEIHEEQNSWSFIQTVKQKQDYYTQREMTSANTARRFQNIIMRPNTRFMADTVIKSLANCPITRRDIAIAEDVYGPNLGSIKGKTPSRTVKHVHGNTDPVPPDILKRHGQLSIAIDIMYVNKIPFLVTNSRSLRFGTITHLSDKQTPTVSAALKAVITTYQQRGFEVANIFADHDFERLRPYHPSLNTTGEDDHVPEIERYIRTVKDRMRSAYRMLPFKYIPRLVLIQLACNCVLWLNAFPHPDGVSSEYSPRYIMTGRELDYNKHARIEFGAYAQVTRGHSNDMNERTVGGICLGPTGNNQGTHYFISLASGKRIHGTDWIELPMPSDVMERINQFGKEQGFPKTLTFADRHGNEIMDSLEEAGHWEDDDEDYVPTEESSQDDEDLWYDVDDDTRDEEDFGHTDNSNNGSSDDPDDVDGQDNTSQDREVDTEQDPGHLADEEEDDDNGQDPEEDAEIPGADDHGLAEPGEPVGTTGASEPVETTGAESRGTTGASDEDESTEEDEDIRTVQEEFDEAIAEGKRSATDDSMRSKRQAKPKRDPSFLYSIFESSPEEAFNYLMSKDYEDTYCFLTEQMTAKKGLKRFKEAGARAIMNELEQIVYRRVMKGKHAHELTREDKKAALRYLMFLKQKRCGKIKARGCADGRKQRLYKTKEETTSPTVTVEGMMLTCLVDAYERRHVATCDIGGAFMHADIDEIIHIRLDGELANLLIRVDETYAQYLTYEHGVPVIYTELSKALYGTLQAAKLFWENLTSFLCDELGFTTNPYDACVANKTINGKQCTIAWHVDDLKISHVELDVVKDIIASLNDRYGKETPLSVTYGNVHDYLGMTIDFSKPGEVSFIMTDYVEELVKEKPTEMDDRIANTPAASHLYQVNENAEPLTDDKAETFHHLVAKLLYLAKRSRPDTLTAVSFLCTRVKGPDVDDWKKLNRCLNYLESTRELYLTIGMNHNPTINWWVDASFAVHPDMKSHTGAAVSLGRGSLFNKSSKQKVNTRSSTEAEVVGVNDAMTMVLWMQLFLDAQGVETKNNVIHQDNMSSILLEKNGKRSSGKQTRHMDIRYFFVTDCVQQGLVNIEYCPTDQMHGDFFTKPLQGSLFRTHRAMILGLDSSIESSSGNTCHEETSEDVMDTNPQERVEPYTNMTKDLDT